MGHFKLHMFLTPLGVRNVSTKDYYTIQKSTNVQLYIIARKKNVEEKTVNAFDEYVNKRLFRIFTAQNISITQFISVCILFFIYNSGENAKKSKFPNFFNKNTFYFG